MLELVLLCTTLRVIVQIKWDNENILDNFRINLLHLAIGPKTALAQQDDSRTGVTTGRRVEL